MPSTMGWADRARSVECATLAQTMSKLQHGSDEERVKTAEDLVEWINYIFVTSGTFNRAFRKWGFGLENAKPAPTTVSNRCTAASCVARSSRTGKRINLG